MVVDLAVAGRRSMASITFSHNGTDCTWRSSSHSAVAQRICAKVMRNGMFIRQIRKGRARIVVHKARSASSAPS